MLLPSTEPVKGISRNVGPRVIPFVVILADEQDWVLFASLYARRHDVLIHWSRTWDEEHGIAARFSNGNFLDTCAPVEGQ